MLYITANQRQANQLRANAQTEDQIFTWQEAIAWLWQNYAQAHQIQCHWLMPIESQLLWKNAVMAAGLPEGNDSDALTALAMQAYQIMFDWCIPLSALELSQASNAQWLKKVIQHYQIQCQQLQVIDAVQALQKFLADATWCAKLPFIISCS
jgi:hypothetical protein